MAGEKAKRRVNLPYPSRRVLLLVNIKIWATGRTCLHGAHRKRGKHPPERKPFSLVWLTGPESSEAATMARGLVNSTKKVDFSGEIERYAAGGAGGGMAGMGQTLEAIRAGR